ncbi:MAG TPA: hypothetical protein VHM30_15055 [Gemmatimonadaceae bacterium]|nr:hypothetical protein [Gemmatimonadaceae bacterium]
MPAIADLHVMINHFPVILAVVGTFFAIVAFFVRRRGVWQYATATLALAGLAAVPTFFTGEPAEDGLRDAWYISRRAIHTHEEAGDFALWTLLAAGLIAAYAWWRLRAPRPLVVATGEPGTTWGARELPAWLRALVLASALLGTATVFRAAQLGGDITHHSTILKTTPRPAGVPVESLPPRPD